MIQKLLICDSTGYPFFSRNIDKDLHEVDMTLLSGLISSIGALGKELFKKKIANISYGESPVDSSQIFIVTKDIISEGKSIYFVFFIKRKCDTKLIKEISTTIFIECKNILKMSEQYSGQINNKVNLILENRFGGLRSC